MTNKITKAEDLIRQLNDLLDALPEDLELLRPQSLQKAKNLRAEIGQIIERLRLISTKIDIIKQPEFSLIPPIPRPWEN